jgi:membrane associated rhomboid family serine protease
VTTPAWVLRLERRFEHWTIPHLAAYIAGMNAAVWGLAQLNPAFLGRLTLEPDLVRSGELWRVFTFLFIPPPLSLLWLVFWIYLLYSYARALEDRWGEFPFNLYYGLGAAATVLASLALGEGRSNVPLNASLFLAFAALNPDFQLLLFFILPVKVKWLALLTWIYMGWRFLVGDWTDRLTLLSGVVNYAAFFGPHHFAELRLRVDTWRRRRRYKDAFK